VGDTEAGRATLLSFAQLAEQIGTPYLRIFGGGTWGTPLTDENYRQAVEVLNWWQEQKKKNKWQVEILIETHDAFSATPPLLKLFELLGRTHPIIWDSHHTWRLAGETPAIISVYLGDMLTDIVEQIEKGTLDRTLKGGQIDLGARTLPEIPRHSGDRNRTSPFAFTGNKFEFRAVGSSQSVGLPVTILNTIVAESLDFFATELERLAGAAPSAERLQEAAVTVMQGIIRQHKRVIFNGDGYTAEWHAEAERRGLPNLRDSTTAIPVLKAEKNAALFEKYKVFSRAETESRAYIYIEKYAKEIQIESEAMVLLARQQILPAALAHQTLLATTVAATQSAGVDATSSRTQLQAFATLLAQFVTAVDALDTADNHHDPDAWEHAHHLRHTILPLMQDLRRLGDELETHVASHLWPLPSYRELLFIK
jgi:glutamine synthetase